jgi:hypothetical protein
MTTDINLCAKIHYKQITFHLFIKFILNLTITSQLTFKEKAKFLENKFKL